MHMLGLAARVRRLVSFDVTNTRRRGICFHKNRAGPVLPNSIVLSRVVRLNFMHVRCDLELAR